MNGTELGRSLLNIFISIYFLEYLYPSQNNLSYNLFITLVGGGLVVSQTCQRWLTQTLVTEDTPCNLFCPKYN